MNQEGTTPSIQRNVPSSDLNPLDQQGTTSNPSDQGGTASSSSMDLDNKQKKNKKNSSSVVSHRRSSIRRSHSSMRVFRYDVFISFRGPDTRNSFVDHLYNHLIRKGIFVYKDDRSLQQGESISPQLFQAIQDSRLSIVVFSKTYAESTWCLDEMTTIAECHRELKRTVFPVFYYVNPSHVRNQNGVYENAFASHTERFKHEPGKVDQWKRAMKDLANLAGWHFRDRPEFAIIENIVQGVTKTLSNKLSGFRDLIGIEPCVNELLGLLTSNSKEDAVQVLGIWGMGGIGKTTLVTVLYDMISDQFDASCFIENVSKIYGDGGAIAVQKQILHRIMVEKNLDTYSSSKISGIVRNRLCNMKVLLVLDNVDKLEQLEELTINLTLLHSKSRIIITTRDEHVLKVYGAHVVYKVPFLNYSDASKLFYQKAFKTEDQNSRCVGLIPMILQYTQALPLAIKVVGSFLCTRDPTMWRDALDRLQSTPDNRIMDVLQVSVDGLQYEDKEIFLHIACFFKGEREDYVKRILDACGLHPQVGIRSLIEKSLITIRNQEIHMHEMLQELGKKIVRHQCPGKPGLWSRLWFDKDFYHVLTTESGSDSIEAIVLDQKQNISKWRAAEGLSKLKSLKLLILYDKNFLEMPTFFSNNLLYLLWHGYPFPFLPPKFEPYYLVELNMPHGSIQQLWKDYKDLPYLKRMDMSNSKHLKETPSFEGIPNLERLDLTGCTNLLQVHPSVGILTKLAFLTLRNCSSLVRLNFDHASNLCSLKVLDLSGCTKLESACLVGPSNLEYLDMDRCASLAMVHESIGALTKLRFLSLRDCINLVSMPNKINAMASVITLDFCGCIKLENLPLTQTVRSLTSMDISFCNLLEVPNAIGELSCLERLNLQGNNFVSLPSTINKLNNLAYLNLAHCHELKSLPRLPSVNAASGGRYFKTVSGSRDHRSGLYIFDCPMVIDKLFLDYDQMSVVNYHLYRYEFQWLRRLIEVPHYFRCGFDIVVPWDWKIIPRWFDHRFDGGSIIRIMHSDVDNNWIGFTFCVAFEVNNQLAIPDSSPLLHLFYLSFESENTEEHFNMPLNLEQNNIDGSKHLWIIYISRQHCHFMKTGAFITFKASPALMMDQWGLRMLTMQDVEALTIGHSLPLDNLVIDNVKESSSSGPKIQFPYNWLFSYEDEVESDEAERKENNLSNLGLQIG